MAHGHHDHAGHDHGHAHAHHHDGTHHHHGHHGAIGNLKVAFFLNLGFTILEIFGGIFTNSIAIMSDALKKWQPRKATDPIPMVMRDFPFWVRLSTR